MKFQAGEGRYRRFVDGREGIRTWDETGCCDSGFGGCGMRCDEDVGEVERGMLVRIGTDVGIVENE